MLKVGLTGNIGSGKTWVCQVFEALNVPVFYADLEARKILNSKQVISEIKEIFGADMLISDSEIDRKKLAAVVFQNKKELEKLNQLIHPKLRVHFSEWAENHKEYPYVLLEAAILFENGFNKYLDLSITVSAPLEIRLQRVMLRDGSTKEEVLARMDNQWNEKRKIAASNFVIINDGQQMILSQVLKIHQQLIT